MFTGIIQAVSLVVQAEDHKGELKIQIQHTACSDFSHLKAGDSVAVNGVCLTLEQLSSAGMHFHIGYETLKITGWDPQKLQGQKVNLESPLKMGGFIGGHIVAGHVDGMAEITNIQHKKGGSRLYQLKVPKEGLVFCWKKAFIAINGVSLTINEVENNIIDVCVVPETLQRTNFPFQEVGDKLTFEIDSLVRAMVLSQKGRF